MENLVEINKEVSIVAYYFKQGTKRLRCFPKKMEWSGKTVIFTEQGLRHPTKKGQRMIHVFDMTDGSADYRLEFDAEQLTWTLVYVADQAYGPMQPLYSSKNLTATA
ncbi:hypothetical protein A3F65_01335 [Candidatus Saccharibacteria bacterium RIFCSPHIGHO2_12_FULL_47_16b]|nr:MAG: hypothetical protein A3F65_01335 [Candidatus Saccharibacteria bacterium RIFCSPHIGHO2_12_FULL_47_16b]